MNSSSSDKKSFTENKEPQKVFQGAASYLTLGIQLAAAVVIFYFLGDWFDKRYGIAPIGMIVGTSIGMIGGFIQFFRSVASMIADEEHNKENDKREN